MLKHFALFLLFATIYINCANAAGTCSATTNNCETGEWCETQTNPNNTTSYRCSQCTNLPSGGDAQYITGPGTTATNCPWEMTCTAGYVWNELANECESCPAGKTSAAVTVTYDGVGYAPATIPQCVKESKPCNTVSSLTGSGLCTGPGVNGDASYRDGEYDYSTCTCTKLTSISNGAKTVICHYNAAGDALDSDTCQSTVERCDAGYCNKSGTDTCGLVEAGYYSGASDKECHECPLAATSDQGATEPGECYWNSDTVFTDSTGKTFKLPANGKMDINPTLLQ